MRPSAGKRALRVAGWAGRLALAGVWLVEGAVAKLLGGRPDELAILAEVGFLGDGRAALAAIGIAETVLAAAIVLPWLPRIVATVQTIALVGFNAAGLVFGGEHIQDPAGMLTKNAALLALAWMVALLPRRG